MLLDVAPVREGVTAPTVTLSLDADTCFTLAAVLTELGTALGRAERSYTARKRWEADEPQRKARKEAFTATVARRIDELKARPRREIVSIIGKEFEFGYDMATFYYRDIKAEERRKAALERNEKVEGLKRKGFTARAIGQHLGLSQGHVKNILTRIRANTSLRTEAATATAS
ncbi:MAG: hypothetical protein HY884_05450 [Deltaproteobacteria bacterium]|nr:hypothetical protein [Deltaproteobacteria bacterium]